MSDAKKILIEMDKILDQLIVNANELLTVSEQTIEEEELIKLQTMQDKLLTLLIEQDDLFYNLVAESSTNRPFPLRARIDKKLEDFQDLNARFLQNITATKGIIQFKDNKKIVP